MGGPFFGEKMNSSENFEKIISLIDQANSQDPRIDLSTGGPQPQELLYSQRMSEMLHRFAPDATEAIQIACHAQHIMRWTSPRDSQPMTREGYFKWRVALYQFHAEKTAELMQQAGYDDEMINRVRTIVAKKNIKTNLESQTMEDVAGLVFIEHYMLPFSKQKSDYNEEKWIGIIRKTWNKLSKNAQAFATSGKLKLPEPLVPLILKSIS